MYNLTVCGRNHYINQTADT